MSENTNHRVTNAILLTKLEGLTALVQQYHEDTAAQLLALTADVTGLKVACAQHDVRITRNEDELDGVRRKGVVWDVINSLGAIGAFLLGKVT